MNVSRTRFLAAIVCGSILGSATILVTAERVTPAEADLVAFERQGDGFSVQNRVINAAWTFSNGAVNDGVVRDRIGGTILHTHQPFKVLLNDGTILDTATLKLVGEPRATEILPTPNAPRTAATLHGEIVEMRMQTGDRAIQVDWSIVLLAGSNYIRQIVTITAAGEKDLPIRRVELVDLDLPGAHVVGSVAGSPIVAGNWFVGFEHPLSQSKTRSGRATAWIDRELPLRAGQSVTYSSVIGVARQGQMRRDFLAYLERERAHPYRTFLHYNSWYDLGFFTPYTSTDAVDRINTFGHELSEKRGVQLDSFLFDDGWDKHDSLWKFNAGFPDGFTPLKQAAERYKADPGVWMSPWGGYSKPKQERIAFGHQAGYEIVGGGYALSGPKYYAAFRDVALEMVQKYGVNQFKFDGTGNVDSVFPGSRFDSDFAAMIHLIQELRAAKPDLFVNLTTGTWPSPFWTMYADSIWRGGDDDSTAGVGTYRERWITYRDADTYQRVVQMGPLYPLNSLMLHGLIYAQHHNDLDKDPGNDFRNEIRSYFGTGTQLQEMYITPSLLSAQNWDDLAEAAKWSRENAEVLKDTHWVGGDPAWLEVYGWASWTPKKGILVLRNPSDHEQTIQLRLQDAFEQPSDAPRVYSARSPWKDDAGRPAIVLPAQEAHEFHLAAFQVLTLDILPAPTAHR
ncbi:enterotoxin [Telmatobacter sp. DSM 110680]|uniref:Enterotoxin n=1 Tax=Telmatobacter sp. DSM 110680 TaxID=3036704 RepID=A0AAU7DER6_9BACT